MSKGPVVGKPVKYETGVTRERAGVEQGGWAKCLISSLGAMGATGKLKWWRWSNMIRSVFENS